MEFGKIENWLSAFTILSTIVSTGDVLVLPRDFDNNLSLIQTVTQNGTSLLKIHSVLFLRLLRGCFLAVAYLSLFMLTPSPSFSSLSSESFPSPPPHKHTVVYIMFNKLSETGLLRFLLTEVHTAIFFAIMQLIVLIFFAASVILIFETLGDCAWPYFHVSNERGMPNPQVSTFFQSWYLITITISTVGYGDVSATTFFGKATAMVFVLFGLSFVNSDFAVI